MMCRYAQKLIVVLCDAFLVCSVFFLPELAVLVAGLFPPCIFFEMGYLCPSCGGTSCVYNMASGNFALAFGYNPMIFLTVIAMVVLAVLVNIEIIFESARARAMRQRFYNTKAVILWAVCFMFFTAFRNLI